MIVIIFCIIRVWGFDESMLLEYIFISRVGVGCFLVIVRVFVFDSEEYV